jgi:MFS family permease
VHNTGANVSSEIRRAAGGEGDTDASSRAGEDDRGRPISWTLLAVLMVFAVFSFIDRVTISMLIDPIRRDLHLSDIQMSFLLGPAFGIFYALFGLPIGWLVDRFPRRRVLHAGVSTWGIATASCGLAATYLQLFFGRMFIGAFEGTLMPAAHSMLADAFSRTRLARAMSLFSAGIVIGTGLSMIVGGAVVQFISNMGPKNLPVLGTLEAWQLVFLATGLPGPLLALLIYIVPELPRHSVQHRSDRGGAGDWTALSFLRARWRLWLAFTLAFGTMNIAFGALLFWQPAYMGRFFHWTPAQYGLALGLIIAIGGTAGQLFSGWMVDRMFAGGATDAHFRYYAWALTLSTPVVLFALLSPHVWVFLGLIWVAQFATVSFLGFASAAVQMTTPPQLRGRMAALFTTVIVSLLGSFGGASIPPALAQYVVHDTVRIGYALALTIGLCVCIALPALLLGMRPLRHAVAEAKRWANR